MSCTFKSGMGNDTSASCLILIVTIEALPPDDCNCSSLLKLLIAQAKYRGKTFEFGRNLISVFVITCGFPAERCEPSFSKGT